MFIILSLFDLFIPYFKMYYVVQTNLKKLFGHFCCQLFIYNCEITKYQYIMLEIWPPCGGLLSSLYGGLQNLAATKGPFVPKGDFSGRTETNR